MEVKQGGREEFRLQSLQTSSCVPVSLIDSLVMLNCALQHYHNVSLEYGLREYML